MDENLMSQAAPNSMPETSYPSPDKILVPFLGDTARLGSASADWDTIFAFKLAFRLRGFTWFKKTVGTPTELAGYVGAMRAELDNRPEWTALRFNWKESFAAAQIYKAANQEVLRFDKAAKVLLTCELAAAAKDPALVPLVHANMRIEPAVFTLASFDEDYIARGERRFPNLLSRIANTVAQPRRVIAAMAAGKTVSYRLARAVRIALIADFPDDPPGNVIIGQGKRHAKACEDETIDGYSDPDANPPR